MNRAERRRKEKELKKNELLDQTWEHQRAVRKAFREKYSDVLSKRQKTLMLVEFFWRVFGGPIVGLYYAFRKEPKIPFYLQKKKDD